MKWIALLGNVAAALTIGASAQAGTSAGDAFARQIRYFFNDQFDRLYNELVPGQQKLIGRDFFLRCYESYDIPSATLESWKTIDKLHVRVLVPGTGKRAWTTAVTLRMKFRSDNTGQTESLTKTAHMLLVNGRWRWMMSARPLAAFKRRSCPPS